MYKYKGREQQYKREWYQKRMLNPEYRKRRREYREKNREYKRKYDSEYYHKNREQILKRIRTPKVKIQRRNTRIFHRGEKARLGRVEALLNLGGACLLCFKTDPFKLEIHHPFGRNPHPKIMIQVCRKCHRKLDNYRRRNAEK